MFRARALLPMTALLCLTACAGVRPRYGAIDDGLALDTVVLYRNGIGYFERRGQVEGDVLRLRVRKDQVNDLLKSLTVVDADGQAVSVSMPLDPRSWANAALATLAPGRGSLAEVLDALRGTEVTVGTVGRHIRGRIVMVERIINEPDPDAQYHTRMTSPPQTNDTRDWKLTLLIGDRLEVVRLSKVRTIVLKDGDLSLQLHRSLDASAGEGMFEQVEIEVRLVGSRRHGLMVSYVVEAPMWKPTYRVVLPESGHGEALLQGWAVVDNVSGEDWSNVALSLTSGAPIAFEYDLHTPRDVPRTDLTESGVRKRARVAMGETSYGVEADEEEAPAEDAAAWDGTDKDEGYYGLGDAEVAAEMGKNDRLRNAPEKKGGKSRRATSSTRGVPGAAAGGMPAAPPRSAASPRPEREPAQHRGPSLDDATLQRSLLASARAKRVTGLTRIDLQSRVTVPDGTSTMVALLNERVQAEEAFLFRPGGAGTGYEQNPYRVVRFKNTSDYVLEPGPIAIYSGGSFVGEGLSEAVGANTSATIPFAVEPAILVTSKQEGKASEMKLVRIVRGVLEVEQFYRTATKYEVKGQREGAGYRVLIRHPQRGGTYELADRPEGTEDLADAYLIPIDIAEGKKGAEIEIVEQTPSKTRIEIWHGEAVQLLEGLLKSSDLDAKARKRLQPIIDLRQKIGRIDTEINGLKRQEVELDHRADQTRQNLEAIKKDPRATKLRNDLNKRLQEFSKDGDAINRQIVDRNRERLELKIQLEDMLVDFDFTPPDEKKKAKAKAK